MENIHVVLNHHYRLGEKEKEPIFLTAKVNLPTKFTSRLLVYRIIIIIIIKAGPALVGWWHF
jgi:hypothetical protein